MPRPTCVTIHADAIRHNLREVRGRAPDSRVMAVVKADGYGHGLERVARALAAADAFGVASLADAERLRAEGLAQPILLLGGFHAAADLPRMRQLRVDTVVHHASQLEMLEQDGEGSAVRCWLKVDTGMHRLGFPPGDLHEIHARLASLPGVEDEIVLMTHFASSEEFEGAQTRTQIATFEAATAGLPGPRSLANSSAVLGWPRSHADWVRPGGALYGLCVVAGRSAADFGLRPAMTLHTRLIAVNRIAKGEPVGYGASWRCPEDMEVGVAAVGYGDGYPRHAPTGTRVLVAGRPAELVGRVSMDLVTIDLRSVPGARPGDPVVLWGDPALPVEAVAEASGTISYELACSITRRVRVAERGDA